jgi:hypothetical protein
MVAVIKGEPAVDMRLDEDDGDQHDHGRDGTEEGTKDQKAFAVGHGETPARYCDSAISSLGSRLRLLRVVAQLYGCKIQLAKMVGRLIPRFSDATSSQYALSPALSGTLQRAVEAADQAFIVKRLFEKTVRPCLDRACPEPFLGKSRHEDDRDVVAALD